MEDLENAHSPVAAAKGFDDKQQVVESFEIQVIHADHLSLSQRIFKRLEDWGVESRGIQPVVIEDRTDTHFIKLFFLWFSANISIVTFALGTLGPTAFGLNLVDSCLTILLINLIFALLPAYLTTWGPKLGLRQLCVARYTFGYYGTIVPSLFSIIHGFGFCIMNSILGGQALESLAPIGGNIAIMLIATISLLISFSGLKAVNLYAYFAWMAVLLVFIIAAGVSGKHFVNAPVTPRATIRHLSNYAGAIGGYIVFWSLNSSDYTVYFPPGVSSRRIFLYSYLGLVLPTTLLQCLGAAAAISVPSVPAWEAGYAHHQVGGLLNAMLSSAGKLGKALMLVLSLSVAATNGPKIYSMCMQFQTLIPRLVVYPRYVFSVFATLLIALLSVVGKDKFNNNLSNFLGLIGHWAGSYLGAILTEHLFFRKRNFANYDIQAWNSPSQLPLGAAALGASVIGFSLGILGMDQVWFKGPLGHILGDTSFMAALTATATKYFFLRRIEKRRRGI